MALHVLGGVWVVSLIGHCNDCTCFCMLLSCQAGVLNTCMCLWSGLCCRWTRRYRCWSQTWTMTSTRAALPLAESRAGQYARAILLCSQSQVRCIASLRSMTLHECIQLWPQQTLLLLQRQSGDSLHMPFFMQVTRSQSRGALQSSLCMTSLHVQLWMRLRRATFAR